MVIRLRAIESRMMQTRKIRLPKKAGFLEVFERDERPFAADVFLFFAPEARLPVFRALFFFFAAAIDTPLYSDSIQ